MTRCLIVGLALTVASCGSYKAEEEELPEVDCMAQAIPTFTQVEAFGPTLCGTCHATTSTDRHGSPNDLNFNVYDSARANARTAAHEVFEGAMPPAPPLFALTEPQKQAVYLWALCGTPQ